jgi:hypothetical protein
VSDRPAHRRRWLVPLRDGIASYLVARGVFASVDQALDFARTAGVGDLLHLLARRRRRAPYDPWD